MYKTKSLAGLHGLLPWKGKGEKGLGKEVRGGKKGKGKEGGMG